MLVLVQWVTDQPADWQEVDHLAWESLPDEPVTAVNVQGVVFEGYDNYAVTGAPGGGCYVTVWNDEEDSDRPMRWLFLPPAHDDRVGGVNTRQFVDVFHDDHPLRAERSSGGAVRKRASFTPPARSRHRRGSQLPDALFRAHQAKRSDRSWEEWA